MVSVLEASSVSIALASPFVALDSEIISELEPDFAFIVLSSAASVFTSSADITASASTFSAFFGVMAPSSS
jgi:hypothetical protein